MTLLHDDADWGAMILEMANCRKVEFRFRAPPGRKVAVAGTFNGWNPMSAPMSYDGSSGCYKAVVVVSPGFHEYRFAVDGTWHVDPNCADSVKNCYGSVNSVICVPART